MSARQARPGSRLRWLLATTAVVGSLGGASLGSTWAAYSDTEVAATQTITAASCFPKDNPGGGKELGHACDKPGDEDGEESVEQDVAPETTTSSTTTSGTASTPAPSEPAPTSSTSADDPGVEQVESSSTATPTATTSPES